MLGQLKLLKRINAYKISNFPKSSLILGVEGCGKHTLINDFITNKFGIESINITSNISLEYINEIYTSSNPMFYVIDVYNLNERQQNIILKLLEEPPKNAYLMLVGTNKAHILPTILNRCVLFEFEPYDKATLKSFINFNVSNETEKLILDSCITPGQVLNVNINSLQECKLLCQKIIDKLIIANYSSTLSIIKKINLKDELDKIDLNIFLYLMLNTILTNYQETNDEKMLELYSIVSDAKNKLEDSRLNKEYVLEIMFSRMWRIYHK